MSLETPRHRLLASLKALRQHWEETKDHWDDPVQRHFEEHYWAPLETAVTATFGPIDRLAQVLVQIRQECSFSK
jgi:hypothetical protein